MRGDEERITLSIPGMVCEGCAETIHDVLAAIPGVSDVRVTIWRKQARVRAEAGKVEAQTLINAVSQAGYATFPVKRS